jgi:Zn-dependent peptidase ImmA (M78 family)
MISKARVKVAREIARKLLKTAKINSVPVILNKVVSSLEVNIVRWQFDDNLKGLQTTYDNTAYIAYSDKNPVVVQRATVSHEIGHFLLKHTDPTNFDRLEYERDQIKENEAWAFARELLMPIKEFKKEFLVNSNIQYLAWRFWVSKDMATIRVIELGLLGKTMVE